MSHVPLLATSAVTSDCQQETQLRPFSFAVSRAVKKLHKQRDFFPIVKVPALLQKISVDALTEYRLLTKSGKLVYSMTCG